MHSIDVDPGWYRSWFDNVEFFDPLRNYSDRTVFMYDQYLSPFQQLIQSQLRTGFRVVIDTKTEYKQPAALLALCAQYPGQCFWITSGPAAGVRNTCVPFWFRIQEQFNMQSNRDYCRDPAVTHQYLLLMNREDHARTTLYNKLGMLNQQPLVSYRAKKQTIAGDCETFDFATQRYNNPKWYNSTAFSIVAESRTDAVFITEKTCKCLIMQHPFLILAAPFFLQRLRELGFETFPELWDESYDTVQSLSHRIDSIYNNVKLFSAGASLNAVVQQKLEHNKARFWDTESTKVMIQKYIVEPLWSFINE